MVTLNRDKIPPHLPDKLSIAFWGWVWFTDTRDDEPFNNMEKCFIELVERGFNTIRIDAMLGWIYDLNLDRRGPVFIGRVASPGYSNNGPGISTKGGFYDDAHVKIMNLFKLAEKFNIYIALTTWQYMDGHSTTLMGNENHRKEINSIPLNDRVMFIAKQFEKLIDDIKSEGYLHRVAYVEIHNESNICKLYEEVDDLKGLTEAGIAYIQKCYPELLICSDRVISGSITNGYGYDYDETNAFIENFADNEQIIDHHLYAHGVQNALYNKAGISLNLSDGEEIDEIMNSIEKNNVFFQWLLKKDYEPWDSFKTHFEYPTFWRKLIYFYENLDPVKYDYWMLTNYPMYENAMKNFLKNSIEHISNYAKQRNLPLVCDEGYVFWPPTNTRFETGAVGKELHEFIVRLFVKYGYWGIMISTYTFPGQPFWEEELSFLKKCNDIILEKEN